MDIESKIVHGGQHADKETGAHAPPIYQTSTFVFRDADHGARLFKREEEGYVYTRFSNPTTDMLAKKCALLESAEAGLIFSSGQAATFHTIVTLASAGDHIISDNVVYGGTLGLLKNVFPRFGIAVSMVDATNTDELKKAMKENTRVVFLETPANPTLKITDIAQCAQLAHEHAIPLCVDNTFATPYLQRPIELGADIVVHSATKYLGGHGDIIGGVVVGKKEFIHSMWTYAKDIGASISPFNAWLVLRGLKTLGVRLDKACTNATKIAEYLVNHEKIDRVYYPGLRTHVGYEIARKQMSKFGAMVGFDVKGGKEAGRSIMNSVRLCTLAVSLGDVDTLIEHPASMTHSGYSDEELKESGINPGFIRLSVGIEHVDDIIQDLDQALSKV